MRSLAVVVVVGCVPLGQEAPAWAGIEPERVVAVGPVSRPPVPDRPPFGPPFGGRESISEEPPVFLPAKAGPRSEALPSGLFNPMPGGIVGGYPQDTGLDIAGFLLPVFAIADATLVYSEDGHTRWSSDDRAVLLELDEPIPWHDRRITHAWYAHLRELDYQQPRDAEARVRVRGGDRLGVSGVANRSPHLHLGLLLDGVVDQRRGSFLLDDEVREVLGGWRRHQKLPAR
jgi:murein DD-endopeptidase MepM/ murein hydrolase activator NlpD